jgi:hypothetical protein
MNTVANTWIDVLGGTPTTDEYQDPVDADTVLHARVPASLIEVGQDTKGDSSMEPMVTRFAKLRVRSTIRIARGHRIKDRRTGFIWTVDTPVDVGSPAHTPDQRVDLRRTVNTLSTAPDA